jgi:TM2 domain-containing membrane protein YozV
LTSKLDVGDVIAKVADLYRRYAGVLLPVAAVIFLVVGLLEWLVSDSVVLSLVLALVAIVATYFYTGMVVNLVDDVRDGRLDQSVGELFNRVTPVLGTLILASILAGIGIAIGFVLLIIPGLVLLTLWAVVAPAILLERRGVFAAFSRSHELVRGNGLQVFAVILVFWLIQFAVSLVLGAIGVGAGDGLQALLGYLGRVVTAPLSALGAGVLYFELKAAHGEGAAPTAAAPEVPGGLAG